jgi:hypothetical protein
MEAKMAYVARPSDFHGATPYQAATQVANLAPAVTPERPSRRRLFLRMLDRLLDSEQRDAEREVAQYMARRGKLTDSMEREIADRFMTGNWGSRYY